MVECAYSNDSMATGFQMIVQLSNFSEVHKLYVNKSTDRNTPASVVVEESGMYQVTIFPIIEDVGIVDADAEFITLLMIDNVTVHTTSGGNVHTTSGYSTADTMADNMAGMN